MTTTEVIVGKVGRAHGIRGEVALELRTDEPERRFATGAVLRVEGARTTWTVESHRWHQDRLLVRFAELADRTAVEAVRGSVLVVDVPVDEAPTDAEEYYDRQLVGLDVLDASGERVGRVRGVLHLAQDLLEVSTDGGVRLVPFVEALVPEVDLAAGHLRLADVKGLLEDLDDDEPVGDGSGA
ncbi:ribosome maturation factor RimM [Mariniluteicoccus endophyticus]